LSRDFEHPEQEDIDEIIRLLKEIRDLLTGFIYEDFERLVHRDFADDASFFRQHYAPAIKQNIYDAIGYINAHRYDPAFKDGVRNIGFFSPDVRTKKRWFSRIKDIWNRVKGGPIKIARRIADVSFGEGFYT
jgi:hypothetical protein